MDPKDEIKSRIDLAELIGEYLPLKPAGPSRFRATCPFHTEKTPSFHVSADKQIWHCFGCGEGGDCFSFVMKMEGMDFPEALLHLGKKAGVEVKRYASTDTNEKRRLMDANDLAAKFFRTVLVDSVAADAARAYLRGRGIDESLAEKFGIGFAPNAWDTLVRALQTRSFGGQELERAGLALRRRSGEGFVDRFRNRIMIPLRDQHGNAVGFTGRVFPNSVTSDEGPKYMNSPETAIYRKGRILFGLDLAKQAIKREGRVIVVEGNLDVVASHKAGVEHVVASSGTALTEEQLLLLKRFTTTIVFSFDADAAGFKAAQRGIALARAHGFDIRVAVLPPEAGKDPDEAVQKNPELWHAAVSKTVPIMQYYIDRAVAGRDLANVDDKRAVAALLLPELSQIRDVIEREHWLQTLSDLLRTDIAALRAATRVPDAAGHPAASDSPRTSPSARLGPQVVGASAPSVAAPSRRSKDEQAARTLLGAFIQDPATRPLLVSELNEGLFPNEILRSLYRLLLGEYHASQSSLLTPASFFHRLHARLTGTDNAPQASSDLIGPLEEIALAGESFVASLPADRGPAQIRELLDALLASGRDRRRKAIEADIRRAEAAGDREAVNNLIRELNSLR